MDEYDMETYTEAEVLEMREQQREQETELLYSVYQDLMRGDISRAQQVLHHRLQDLGFYFTPKAIAPQHTQG